MALTLCLKVASLSFQRMEIDIYIKENAPLLWKRITQTLFLLAL